MKNPRSTPNSLPKPTQSFPKKKKKKKRSRGRCQREDDELESPVVVGSRFLPLWEVALVKQIVTNQPSQQDRDPRRLRKNHRDFTIPAGARPTVGSSFQWHHDFALTESRSKSPTITPKCTVMAPGKASVLGERRKDSGILGIFIFRN
ncbi:hypothetical protein TIFTF001_049089 [Ficus carica]|uniref:Uncharacterized protein n=1 Tax=Ficus carica TaxID=3494 RepID=A0AA87YUS5_FICCA|nr:hypothetical protein TIFTF001_049087 [Ficus carica]GMN23512.1 hypothetical protein TIFTF001_049089 [Ficus carica]